MHKQHFHPLLLFIKNKMATKYLIIGTGGVGGSIAGFLALAGHDVTCIARGAHLKAMQEKGLKLKSGLKGDHTVHASNKQDC